MALRLLLFPLALMVTQGALSARPRLTECRSPELETFTCRWTGGNSSRPVGGLRVLYAPSSDATWRECPDYRSGGENSCSFHSSHAAAAAAGGGCCLRLVHAGGATLDEYCFRQLGDILRPDPPTGLTWAPTNLSHWIQVAWEPPPAAARQGGLHLLYELQYKEDANQSEWQQVAAANATSVPVGPLGPDRKYAIRVRCRGLHSGDFGPFSAVLSVSLSRPSRGAALLDPEFPWPLFIIFGTLGAAAVLLLIRFSKQRRLRPWGLGTLCTKRKLGQRDAGASY